MTKQRFENAARFDFLPSSCKLEECALRVACTISTILKKSKEREKNKIVNYIELLLIRT